MILGSTRSMVEDHLKSPTIKHLAALVCNFQSSYIRKLASGKALLDY